MFVSLLIVGCGGGGGDNPSEVQFKTISAGGFHSLALSNNGKVYAAGYNEYGQLGLGDNTNRNAFTEVASLSGKNITALSAGYEHSLALSNSGKVYATGWNNYGQLGLGDNTDRNAFTEVTDLSGKNIIALSAGIYRSLALSSNGKVYATGRNHYGQLGLGDNTNTNTFKEVTDLSGITAIFAGGNYSFAISNDGKVYATGRNNYGQLGLDNNDNKNTFTDVTSLSGKTITALSASDEHSFAISNDGKVYATGRNNYGQLGSGDNTDCDAFAEVSSLSGKTIIAIAVGYEHSLALSSDRKIYATGDNYSGQLG
ncbi:MAG: hypothetical protein LBE89_08370 [Helicobacteraceae bacterium]|nr:hypothetical protein [Helicobacteraceae bacterium]